MFNLEALVLTAHIAQLNNLYYDRQQSFIDLHQKSIKNALRFYGRYYIDYPSGRTDCLSITNVEPSTEPYDAQCPISYEPYFGEYPTRNITYLFTLAQKYYPEDKSFYKRILSANQQELIPGSNFHPLHAPASVFTFFFAEE
jgi:hypothetical protein